MDANTLRKIIEGRISQFEGNAFQDMSDRLGSVLFPGDYHPVRPGGRHGDTKNDGYCPKARVFFAAHATRRESAEKSKAKIEGDLEGCLKQHRDVKVWRYVTNDTLIGEVDQFIDNVLRPRHPRLTIEIWGHKRLADEISLLEHADVEKILDLNYSNTIKNTDVRITQENLLPYVYTAGVFGGNGQILRFSACQTFNLSEDFIIPEQITLLGRTINFGNHPPIKAGESIRHTGIDDLEYPPTDEERFVEIFFTGRNGQRFVARQKMSYESRQDGKFNINGLSRPVVEQIDET